MSCYLAMLQTKMKDELVLNMKRASVELIMNLIKHPLKLCSYDIT